MHFSFAGSGKARTFAGEISYTMRREQLEQLHQILSDVEEFLVNGVNAISEDGDDVYDLLVAVREGMEIVGNPYD